MSVFKINLPENYNWEDVNFYDGSLWGNGNDGKNLWGWKRGANLTVSKPQLASASASESEKWFLKVTATNPSPKYGEGLCFISRCKLNDEEIPNGVFSSNQVLPYEE